LNQFTKKHTIKIHSLKKKELTDKLKKCFFAPKELNKGGIYGPYIFESNIDQFTPEELKTIITRVGQNTTVIMGALEGHPSTEK
jgi:hypothetical protein